ncbi:unnamed protein product [Lampetra planeri]
MAGQRTPLLDKREDGELSSEYEEASTSRRKDGLKTNEMEEVAPAPTVAEWAEEVETREDEGVQEKNGDKRVSFERAAKRKRRAPSAPLRIVPLRGPQPSDSSTDLATSEEEITAMMNQRRGFSPKPMSAKCLLDLVDENCFSLLQDVSEPD